jgi:hypothetical protein
MFDKKNLLATLGYSAFCVGCLGLMSDFGTALIFFVSLLAITFLRSGDLASVLFMIAAAISGGYIILQFKSYIFARFAIYRHVWEDPANLGYQQTRTMSAIASGGLFGQGVGNGWLKKIGAANTDLVFGVVSEIGSDCRCTGSGSHYRAGNFRCAGGKHCPQQLFCYHRLFCRYDFRGTDHAERVWFYRPAPPHRCDPSLCVGGRQFHDVLLGIACLY